MKTKTTSMVILQAIQFQAISPAMLVQTFQGCIWHISRSQRKFSMKGGGSLRYPPLQASTKRKAPWFRFEGTRERTPGSWDNFHEALHHTSGLPTAICMYCNVIYKHPKCFLGKPTITLNRHVHSCSTDQRSKQGGSQPSIITGFSFNQLSE